MLNQEDFKTPEWRRIKDHLMTRIDLLRTMNDGDQDPIKTANIRGAIAELKALLALDKHQARP